MHIHLLPEMYLNGRVVLSMHLFREFLALKVYVALCYYKLDYYDVSQEVLAVYLQSVPDSTIALNLKACNHFRLYNGKAAEVRKVRLMLLLRYGTCFKNWPTQKAPKT